MINSAPSAARAGEEPTSSLVATGPATMAGPVAPPPDHPLMSGDPIRRDCGLSVHLGGARALWVFCDTTDATAPAVFRYFHNSTAAYALDDAPTVLYEPSSPTARPYRFIDPLPGTNPCTGEFEGYLHVIWPFAVTRVPGANGTDRVIVYFMNYCWERGVVKMKAFTPRHVGVGEMLHDPRDPTPWDSPIKLTTLTADLFPLLKGHVPQEPWSVFGEAAVTGDDGNVYVYRCEDTWGCQVARAPWDFVDAPWAYEYATPDGGWAGTPPDVPTVELVGGDPPPAAFNVVYEPSWGRYVMAGAARPGVYVDEVEIRLSESPTGPFGPPLKVKSPACAEEPKCYAGYVHEAPSDGDTVALSFFERYVDPDPAGQVHLFTAPVALQPGALAGECRAPFTDVPSTHTFCAAIAWFAREQITNGWSDGTFRPSRSVTRQAMAAWFHRWSGRPGGPFPSPGFTDVSESHPFRDEIAWFAASGLGGGYADGSFGGARPVSRQALAAWFYRAAGSPEGPFPDPGFSDVPPEHPFAHEIAWLAQSGITTGYADGAFRPTAPVSRQAVAAFFQRYGGYG